jgi:hypothetical protein
MKYTIEDLRDDLSREFGGGHMSATSSKPFKGGGGGDGGAAARKAAEDKRIAAAIKQLNQVFGVANATPDSVDKNSFYTNAPVENSSTNNWMGNINGTPSYTRVFDKAGYDAAVAAARAKADDLNAKSGQRQNLYSKIGQDATNVAMTDLNKERDITERELKFQLARNGLSGGSRDIDANRDILDNYQQGVLKASNLGTQTANDARSSDEKTRVNLINSIQAGLTAGDAVQQAYAGMSNNAASAQDAANATSLAGFFDVLRSQQEKSQYQAGVNSTQQQTFTSPYSKTSKSSYGGTVRSVA